MEDKENVLKTFGIDTDNLGVVQAKYEVKTLRIYINNKYVTYENDNIFAINLVDLSFFCCLLPAEYKNSK